MNEAWITQAIGRFEAWELYTYAIPGHHISTPEKVPRFKGWLMHQPEIALYSFNEDCFTTFLPIAQQHTAQFPLLHTQTVYPPFDDSFTKAVQKALHHHFKLSGERKSAQNPQLDFCEPKAPEPLPGRFRLYIEWFNSGGFLVQWCPAPAAKGQQNTPQTDSDKETLEKPEPSVTLKDFVRDLNRYLLQVPYPGWLPLQSGSFFQVQPKQPLWPKNLQTGLGEQGIHFRSDVVTAAWYHGFYRPVHRGVIVPLVAEGADTAQFNDCISRFNKQGEVIILPPYPLANPADEMRRFLLEVEQKYKEMPCLITVFCDDVIPPEKMREIQRYHFRMINCGLLRGAAGSIMVSDFACRVLGSMGGIIAVPYKTALSKGDLFMGLHRNHEAGIMQGNKEGGVAVFDEQGLYRGGIAVKQKEGLAFFSEERCLHWLWALKKRLRRIGVPEYNKLILHLSERIPDHEMGNLKRAIYKTLAPKQIDICIVRSSGTPLMVMKDAEDAKQLVYPAGGMRWFDETLRYGLLFPQRRPNAMQGLTTPVSVLHTEGTTPLAELMEQIYWLTKVYPENLFQEPRQPATLRLARQFSLYGVRDFRVVYDDMEEKP